MGYSQLKPLTADGGYIASSALTQVIDVGACEPKGAADGGEVGRRLGELLDGLSWKKLNDKCKSMLYVTSEENMHGV